MSLNYFLNKKIVKNLIQNFKSYSFFTFNLPSSFEQKMKIKPIEEIQQDIYLTNYLKSYNESKYFKVHLLKFAFNIAALLFLENEQYDNSFLMLLKLIKNLENDCQPKFKKEKMVWNIIEIFQLIRQINFKINEDNYELIIHILFKNTEFNLDRKINYFRNNNKNLQTNLTIDFVLIDNEMKELFKFINAPALKSFGGFTKAIIIFIELLIIQPYKRYNLILSFIMIQWYLIQDNPKDKITFNMFIMTNLFKDFIKQINCLNKKQMLISNVLMFARKLIKKGIINTFITNYIFEWIDNDYKTRIKYFPTDYEIIILEIILSERTEKIEINEIYRKLLINKKVLLTKEEIKKTLKFLTSVNILKTNKLQTTFSVVNKQLNKIKYILK